MKYGKFLTKISAKHNGTFFNCIWERPLKTRRGVSNVVTKEVVATVRKGIDRRNMKKYTSGAAKFTSGPLVWGKWKKGLEGLVIEYTNAEGKTNHYARLYTTNNTPKVKYFIDGREVSRECIEALVPKSQLSSEDIIDCFTINIKNIKEIV